MANDDTISIIKRRAVVKRPWRTSEVVAITGGPYVRVRGGQDETFVLALCKGESLIVWLGLLHPVRVTNLGNGKYRVSRPWPWILGGEKVARDVVSPRMTLIGRLGKIAHLA